MVYDEGLIYNESYETQSSPMLCRSSYDLVLCVSILSCFIIVYLIDWKYVEELNVEDTLSVHNL